MYYKCLGSYSAGYRYEVTLKLYRGCEPVDNDHSALDPTVSFTVYDMDHPGAFYQNIGGISLRGPTEINKQRDDPCILNAPAVCYQIGTYTTTVTLPLNKQGYTIAFQRCCRNDELVNVNTSSEVGATYFAVIPGTDSGIPGDNSPEFTNEEAVLICSHGRLNYSYTAEDPDGDSLVYAFAPGNIGGDQNDVAPEVVPSPPYPVFGYLSGFSASAPLGPDVKIDPASGMISGITDLKPGTYDVCVAVFSYRGGKLLGTHLKDFQVDVHDCQRVVLADIPPLFNDCRSATVSFPDQSTPGKTYVWDFGDGDTSHAYTPTHVYRDTGVYHVWIKVDPASSCGDSMESEVRVYPGLQADFTHLGNCLEFPTAFTDRTRSPYGQVNSWSWDFGVGGAVGDTSAQPAPVYQYAEAGTYSVRLSITTDKGCAQSDTQQLTLYGRPALQVSSDTLLCYKDSLALHAEGPPGGTYRWEPDYRIAGVDEADPKVHPGTDTTYRVTYTDVQGCTATDSVRLRVKRVLKVEAPDDTVLCQGDPLPLRAASDDDYAFSWYDGSGRLLAQARNAEVAPEVSDTYRVEATLGSCKAQSSFYARVAPYPQVTAAPDTGICAGDQIRLRGSGGAYYSWYPGTALSDSTSATPLASPADSTFYTLTVTDTLGCPKPVSKTILVGVIPPVPAFAGNDTIITTGQRFQLHASGANTYAWTPVTGLSDPDVSDPIVTWTRDITYQVKVTEEPEGCFALDTIHIRYITGPEIYVPSAFTPNGDGMNDLFRPIPVGIRKMDFFRVYDRWGRLMFETTRYMEGWDGRAKGKQAPAGGYVWMARGEDFNGRTVMRKGTVVLVR